MQARPDPATHTYEKNAEVSDFSPYEIGHHGDVMTHKNISSPNIDESKLKVRISNVPFKALSFNTDVLNHCHLICKIIASRAILFLFAAFCLKWTNATMYGSHCTTC